MIPKTQRESWDKTQPELGTRQFDLLHALYAFGPQSAWQLSDRLHVLVHAVRPRLTELQKLGKVIISGTRWEERTKRHEAVWKALSEDKRGQLELI